MNNLRGVTLKKNLKKNSFYQESHPDLCNELDTFLSLSPIEANQLEMNVTMVCYLWMDSRFKKKGAIESATAFLSEGHQPEVPFFYHWGVVRFKLSGKSSL